MGATLFPFLFACTPARDSSGSDLAENLGPTTIVDARPAALVNGKIVEWRELRPLLNEAAGSQVLQEVILDRMIAEEIRSAGIRITPDDIDRERQLFYSSLSPDPHVSTRVAQELRDRQGLGRERFAGLLRRNAMLRALVADNVQVTDETVRRTYDLWYGPKRQARMILSPTLREAEQATRRLDAGEFFGDVAVEVSTDASAPRGGLLAPMSRGDPSYPQAIREALWGLEPGEISSPVLTGDAYAVLMLIEEQPGEDADFDQVRPEMAQAARLNQERVLMEQTARRLLAQATVTIIDEALQESWESQPARRR